MVDSQGGEGKRRCYSSGWAGKHNEFKAREEITPNESGRIPKTISRCGGAMVRIYDAIWAKEEKTAPTICLLSRRQF